MLNQSFILLSKRSSHHVRRSNGQEHEYVAQVVTEHRAGPERGELEGAALADDHGVDEAHEGPAYPQPGGGPSEQRDLLHLPPDGIGSRSRD